MNPLDYWHLGEPLLPAAIGAILGNRYKSLATWRERLVGWLLSMATGYYLGAAFGAYFGLPQEVVWGVMFTLGSIGTQIIAYLFAVLRDGIANPSQEAGRWVDIILGRRRSESKE